MIKIERMSEGCKATVNGSQIFVGQLFGYNDIESLVVTEGKVMYTIDEAEVKEVEAAVVVQVAPVVKKVTKPAMVAYPVEVPMEPALV
jgi:hypothetical protein